MATMNEMEVGQQHFRLFVANRNLLLEVENDDDELKVLECNFTEHKNG